nr:PRC-barrel domain-containing protein [uncultured Steroidobacter sp.]
MSIGATDGELGSVRDAYFDDQHWTLRYLVVNPGSWLTARRVLISPWAIRDVNWNAQRVDVALTREQVRNSPGIESDKPVSRQYEAEYSDYYGYPYYWAGPLAWGSLHVPEEAALADLALQRARDAQQETEQGDPHLRSANEVDGYNVEAVNGAIGHVDGFIFDDTSWSLRYFVVDTRNWLPGRHVLISTDWIERVSWENRKAHVVLTRDEVRNSPEYDAAAFTQAEEEALHRYYGQSLRQHGRKTKAGNWELPI